jgi:hypothetical protein
VSHLCESRLTVTPYELLSLRNFDDIGRKELGQKKKNLPRNDLCSTISNWMNMIMYHIIAFLLSSTSSTYYTSTWIFAWHASIKQARLKLRIFLKTYDRNCGRKSDPRPVAHTGQPKHRRDMADSTYPRQKLNSNFRPNFEVFWSSPFHALPYYETPFNYTTQNYNFYSLHTVIVFLPHVSVSHSTSSGRTFVAVSLSHSYEVTIV